MSDIVGAVVVLEVDQWTSTGNIRKVSWKVLQEQGIDAVSGGDSEAAKAIFGGRFSFRVVKATDKPSIGTAWFINGPAGFPVMWQSNYDSSD